VASLSPRAQRHLAVFWAANDSAVVVEQVERPGPWAPGAWADHVRLARDGAADWAKLWGAP
jgi:hypothetical protein